MSISMGIFTFLNAWWIMLFLVLPFGIEREQNPNPLEYAAAPRAVNWKKKLIITTVLSMVVTAALALLVHLMRNP